MKTEYRKEFDHCFLIVTCSWKQTKDFAIRMMEENKIEYLFPVTSRMLNGHLQLYYEVTNLTPLTEIYDHMPMSISMIRRLFQDMRSAVREAERFFLEPGDILFDPSFIFADPDTGAASFCCVPGRPEPVKPDALILAEYILKRLDHADRDAVKVGYDFYREISSPGALLSDALREMTDPAAQVPRASLRSLELEQDWTKNTAKSAGKGSSDRPLSGETRSSGAEAEKADTGTGKKKKARSLKNLSSTAKCAMIIIPVSMVAAALLIFFSGADLSAAGGLFFLAGALDWLVINSVRNARSGRQNLWAPQMETSEEEAFMQSLLQDVYDRGK